jgi:hypothetical protein
MANTLNLVDLDDAELLRDVKRTFGIKVTHAEAAALRNVGDLYDLIEAKSPDAGSTRACLTQVAFYRLRRALRSMGVVGEIGPQTPLSALDEVEPRPASARWRQLARAADLVLPRLETPALRWLPDAGTNLYWWLSACVLALLAGLFVASLAITDLMVGRSGWSHLGAAVAFFAT